MGSGSSCLCQLPSYTWGPTQTTPGRDTESVGVLFSVNKRTAAETRCSTQHWDTKLPSAVDAAILSYDVACGILPTVSTQRLRPNQTCHAPILGHLVWSPNLESLYTHRTPYWQFA